MSQDRDPAEYHQPVMADEVVELLRPLTAGVIVDATFGGGGHTRRLAAELGEGIRIVAIDRDPDALANANGMGDRVTTVRGDFAELGQHLDRAGIGSVVGVLFDFGVSSHQLDQAGRGFSYRADGPLDMRMDPDSPLTAEEVVNTWSVDDLTRIIRRYGEDPNARRIASAIVARRPLRTTLQLAEVVAQAVPAAVRREGHPARRTFQALRIVVNRELEAIEAGLDAAIERLAPAGRLVAIAYHSLEDRIVKQRLARGAAGCVCPPDLPVCACGAEAELRILTRRARRPRPEEVAANPRARSARLRAAEKVAAA